MGSLVSTPSAPPPIVVPAPQPPPEPEPVQTVLQSEVENEESTPEVQASENRRRSLLARNRGRLGTIATGFQGFLSQTQSGDGRKTLLGE